MTCVGAAALDDTDTAGSSAGSVTCVEAAASDDTAGSSAGSVTCVEAAASDDTTGGKPGSSAGSVICSTAVSVAAAESDVNVTESVTVGVHL